MGISSGNAVIRRIKLLQSLSTATQSTVITMSTLGPIFAP
jgi:hypothetical protein